MPSNFGNLANTLQSLTINSHYGNDLLNLISEFTHLKEADLRSNDFTGKTPYYPHSKIYFDFSYNNFTEFDWRYLEDYAMFMSAFNNFFNKLPEYYIPQFKHNKIEGTLPSYINEEFISMRRYNIDRYEIFLGEILGYNPIYNGFADGIYKYLGWQPVMYVDADYWQ